jgi:hypothetical protein
LPLVLLQLVDVLPVHAERPLNGDIAFEFPLPPGFENVREHVLTISSATTICENVQ